MSLKDRLVADMTQAMKNKDANKLSTLRMAKAAVMNEENKRGVGTVLTDDEVAKILQSLVKQRRDSITQFEAAGRTELAESRFRRRNHGSRRSRRRGNRRKLDEGHGLGDESRSRQSRRQIGGRQNG